MNQGKREKQVQDSLFMVLIALTGIIGVLVLVWVLN